MPGQRDIVAEVIERHRAELTLPGVLSIRPGWQFTGGWPVSPPRPAVVVTVAVKTSDPPGGALLPAALEGVAVDVRQASPRKLLIFDRTDGADHLRRPPAPDAADPPSGALPQFADETTPAGHPVTALIHVSAAAVKEIPQIPYSPADVPLEPVSGTLTVRACVSPDAGWPVLEAFLGAVTETLTIGMYDWTSKHILDTVTVALAGKTVTLVLDHPTRNPTADQSDEDTVAALKTALAGGLTQAWALERSDPLAAAWEFPSAYHIKVAVADHARVWLSSGNWNNSNQPDIDPVTVPGDATAARVGDRDWHVVIDSPQLAATFEAYLAHDLTVALAHQKPTAEVTEFAAQSTRAVAPVLQTPPFTQFWGPLSVTETMTITPVLTPDSGSYASHVQALIDAATSTLYMQFQYIELPADTTTAPAGFAALITSVMARQKAGVDVRIIMSEYEVQGYLEKLITAGLDVATSVKIQNNVHNKGVVVDGATVLVSSQNWSGAGTTANRDAGVIISNPTLASYFQRIFLHDWNHLATTTAAED